MSLPLPGFNAHHAPEVLHGDCPSSLTFKAYKSSPEAIRNLENSLCWSFSGVLIAALCTWRRAVQLRACQDPVCGLQAIYNPWAPMLVSPAVW